MDTKNNKLQKSCSAVCRNAIVVRIGGWLVAWSLRAAKKGDVVSEFFGRGEMEHVMRF